jgi:terminase small subunit / prophage DNA-packing protein
VIDLTGRVTQAEFGEMIGVSQPAVSKMLTDGVLSGSASVGVWLREYSSHMREMAAGRAAAGDLDLATERAGLARAQREKIEMQNQVTRKELAPSYLLEEILAKAGTKAAAILDTIPGMIKRRVPSLSADDVAAIAREVAKARNIAASISLSNIDEAEPDSADDIPLVDV